MAIHDALRFILRVREDAELRRRVEALGDEGAADLARLGAEVGLSFTDDELQRAFVVDWNMRWARYGAGAAHRPVVRLPDEVTSDE